MDTKEPTRSDVIHSKGFSMSRDTNTYKEVPDNLDFSKIKVGIKSLEDAVLDLGSIKSAFPRHPYGDKNLILKAIAENDVKLLREISNFFYNTNGVYARTCNYFAFLYRYDWYIASNVKDESADQEKVLRDFSKLLDYFDESHIKKICGDIALGVIKNGAYYGYIVDNKKSIAL